MSVAAVVLASGFSRRLGESKQAAEVGGVSLLQRAVRVAQHAGMQPVIAVVSDSSWVNPLQALGATVLLNPLAQEGIAASIRAGVRWAQALDVNGVVLMTCDQVAVTADHLRALCIDVDVRMGSGYAGRVAVPAYFPRADFAELLSLEGDVGARELLRSAASVATEALAFDVDTPEDLVRARTMFRS